MRAEAHPPLQGYVTSTDVDMIDILGFLEFNIYLRTFPHFLIFKITEYMISLILKFERQLPQHCLLCS
jgi:hypothetical protein